MPIKELTKTLTTDEKAKAITVWNNASNHSQKPPSLKELSLAVYGVVFDGRTQEGRALKHFMGEQSYKVASAHNYAKKHVALKESQKEFIDHNAASMKPLEIAKLIFDKPNISASSEQFRVVTEYIKELNPCLKTEAVIEEETVRGYSPPKTEAACINRANKYISVKIDKNNMGPKTRKDIKALIGFLHNLKFLMQLSVYKTPEEVTLFESTFIRYVHNKYDLTEEEVDQYIIIATEVVNCWNIDRQVADLRQSQKESLEEDKKLSMSLVEAIGKASTEKNQSTERQNKMFKNLTTERKKRLEKKIDQNASLLNFVELWKMEETRKQMLEMANKRLLENKDEIQRLGNMDDLKARIFGATEDRSLYG